MFTTNTIVQQHLQLLRLHCQEWKSFLQKEIQERRRMGIRHELEKRYFHSIHINCFAMAALLNRQTMELWEFRAEYQSRRMFLREKQNRQKSDSLETMRRSGFQYLQQKM